MPDNGQMQEEAAELQQLQQLLQMAQSGDVNAMPQMVQILTQMIQAQQKEMQDLQGADGQGSMPQQAPSFKQKLGAAMAKVQAAKQGGQPPQGGEQQ